MPIPFLDLKAQYQAIKTEVDPAIHTVLDSCAYASGPSVEAFENAFAMYCGVSRCIGVNSGTAAITLLLQAHDIGPGDEVITVANTFFATAEAVSALGAIPVLVDCEEKSALMDVTKIERAITKKTKAIIPVHLYGQPADMDEINGIAHAHHLLVFEDACQAHGATYKGKPAGSLADGAAFSFYPGKNLGAYGEAGAALTNDEEIAKRIRMLREHGSPKKYHHDLVGWNERMDGIQGAVLTVKLRHLDEWNAARRRHAATYRKLLPKNVNIIAQKPDRESNYHLFVVRVPERDRIQTAMKEHGIDTGIHYPVPVHMQPAYRDRGWKNGNFPAAEKLSREILSLPMFAELIEAQIEEVCSTLGEIL